MKGWKNGHGIVNISKKEWDKMFREFHPTPCNVDYRKLPFDILEKMKCKICPKCGGIGVTDYDFEKKEWCLCCRECRTRLD